MLQENPIWNDKAFSKDVREPDAYQPSLGTGTG